MKRCTLPRRLWMFGASLVLAGAAGLALGGEIEERPYAEKGKFHFGPGGATDYTDKDIAAIGPAPFERWPGAASGKKADWGRNWQTMIMWESPYHNDWNPLRSPEHIALFERAGVDMVTTTVDMPSIRQHYTAPLEILGAGDRGGPLAGPSYLGTRQFGEEWVRRTGRGLIPSTIWVSDEGGCDGTVFYGRGHDDKRWPAGHSSICYSSPNTFRYTVRKIKGLQEALGNLATGPDGKFYAYFFKEVSKYLYLRDGHGKFAFSCYCPYCKSEFRNYLKGKYASLEAVNQAHGKRYREWEDIDLPVTENRMFEPQRYYDFIKFREWIRMENGEKLWRDLGLTNVNNDGTFQFASWYFAPFIGFNAYHSSVANDIVNLDFGEPFGPRAAIPAMVDSVLRDHPEKRAIALFGGGPSLYLNPPGTFMRQIGSHFGHVSYMRGVQFLGWDSRTSTRASSYYYYQKFMPWAIKEMGWWAHFGELQADLLDGMKTVKPQIASYHARPSILFEEISLPDHPDKRHPERSKAWTWHPMMFWQSHFPIHILHPEQVEQGDLTKYEVLYCLYGPRNTPETLKKIREFYDAGGFVYGAFDALTWTLSEEDWSTVEHVFKVGKLTRRIPRTGFDEEKTRQQRVYRWGSKHTEPLGYYEITHAHPALPPVGTKLPVTSAVRTVRPLVGAKVYATYKGDPCIVGTDRTLFVGTDIMSDIAHTVPRAYKAMSEPWQLNYPSLPREEFAHVLQTLTGFAEFAGAKPPAAVSQNGEKAWNIQTGWLSREDGAALYTLANSEDIGGRYEVALPVPADGEVADLVSGKRLAYRNGTVELEIPGFGFAMLLAAAPDVVERALRNQLEVERRVSQIWDIELSRHFFVQAPADQEYDGLGYPLNWGISSGVRFLDANPHSQAIIVLPDAADARDERLAARISEFFRDYPVENTADGMRRLNVELPIRKASELTENEKQGRNLLLIGAPAENTLAARLLPSDALRQQASGDLFTTHRPNPDEVGGNLLVIGATVDQRDAEAFKRLRRWAFTWFDTINSPIAPDILAEIAVRSLTEHGWRIIEQGELVLTAEKDGERIHCLIYAHGLSDAGQATAEFLKRVESGSTVVICDAFPSEHAFTALLRGNDASKLIRFARADTIGEVSKAAN